MKAQVEPGSLAVLEWIRALRRRKTDTIITHSATTDESIVNDLGHSDYSYYFLLKAFRPVLQTLGTLVEVSDPWTEVDLIYEACRSRGEACTFLCFAPPHKSPIHLKCPTIPIFA